MNNQTTNHMKTLKTNYLNYFKSTLFILALLLNLTVMAQVAINADGSSPETSAMLDIKSDTAGILIPRMTMVQRDAISNPATGLMIYQTDDAAGFYHYDGSNWKTIGSDAFAIDDLADGKACRSNVFLGFGAGGACSSANFNAALGYEALYTNSGGEFNTAIGFHTLYSNTYGESNTATGHQALFHNIEGSYNIAFGQSALVNNTSGGYNTAAGSDASGSNTSGSHNTTFGYRANYNNLTGSDNTILGYQAGDGSSGVSISGNIFLGYQAGYNEAGDNKLYIENSNSSTPLIYGEFDNDIVKINGNLEVTGSFIGIGIDDLSDGKSDGSSVFLGASAGTNNDGTDNSNTAIGSNAMYSNTIGVSSTAIGYSALHYSTESNYNTACGAMSLFANSIGEYNTALGFQASNNNTTGDQNISIGTYANLYNQTGSYNTIIGTYAGAGTALHNKSGNVFLGYSAGFNETGDNKLYIENSSSSNPLIYGEFDNDILAVNGYLGVGTQTPGVKLQVVGSIDAILSGGGYLVTGLTSGQNIVMDENEIMARNNGALSAIHLQRDGGAFNLHYSMAESSEFVVASDGKTGIGENVPTAKLQINTISGEDGLRVQINGATKLKVASNGGVAVGYNPTTPTYALQLQNSSVDLEGRGIAYSWTTYSDGRLKTKQKELEYGLSEVMQLQPKSYFHHSSKTNEDGTFTLLSTQKTFTFGFIA